MDADELRDCEDQDPHIPPPSAADLGPYARFLQNLPDYNNMTQEEFDKAFEALPLPAPWPPPPGISYHAAIEASYIHRYTDIISDVAYEIVPYIRYPDIISDIDPYIRGVMLQYHNTQLRYQSQYRSTGTQISEL